MEGLEGLSASLHIGLTLWALWEKAAAFLDRASRVDESFNSLHRTFECWTDAFASVMVAIKDRVDYYHFDPSQPMPSSERDVIDRILFRLKEGDEALKLMSTSIRGIRPPHHGMSMSQNDFIHRWREQLRMDGQRSTLAELTVKLDRQRNMISSHLSSLLTYVKLHKVPLKMLSDSF